MRSKWLGAAVVAAMWAFAAAVHSRLPARVPSHWNLRGEVDGWMGRTGGAIAMPALATGVLLLLVLLPHIDPRGDNLRRSPDWRLFINLIVLFMAVVQVATLGVALGWDVRVDRVILASVGLLLAALGNYLPRIRSNWFVGIRTPWTLDNDRVWRETHRVGGRCFVAGGLALVVAAALPGAARVVLLIAAVVLMAVVPLAYSYVAWRRDHAGRMGWRSGTRDAG